MSTKHKSLNLEIDKLKSATGKNFAIVCSEWNPEIINRLLKGAYSFFERIGISSDKIFELKVPSIVVSPNNFKTLNSYQQ